MAFLLVIFFVLYAILSFLHQDWAVMAMLAALPTYLIRFSVFGLPSTLLEAMILISFTVWLFRNYRRIVKNLKIKIKNSAAAGDLKLKFIRHYPFDWEIILLLLISWLAIITAGTTDNALGIWKAYFFEPILVFILIFNALGRWEKTGVDKFLAKILWPLALSSFIVSLWAVLQKIGLIFSPREFWPRITGPFPYPNALGLYLAPLILLMIGRIVQIFNFQFSIFKQFLIYKFLILKILFFFITIIFSLLAVYLARSEGAIVGIVAGLAIFGLLAGKKMRRATIAAIIVIGCGVMIYGPARNYVAQKFTLRDLSGEIRKQQWRETWQMLSSSPQRFIFGAGLDNYQKIIIPYHQSGIFYNFERDPDFRRKIVIFNEKYKAEHWQPVEIYMYPHNIFLNFWSELGLAGALLFVWIIGKSFVILISGIQHPISKRHEQKNYLALGLLSALTAITVHGIVDVPYFKNDLAIMFWAILALAGFMRMKINASSAEKQ